MPTSPTHFLAELEAGHTGPVIPAAKRAYFQQRLRNRMFTFIVSRFAETQKLGLTKAHLARRTGKSPEQITRWLGAPSNLTLDVASDLLLGIAAEELEFKASSPLDVVNHNYSLFEELAAGANRLANHVENHRGVNAGAALALEIRPQRVLKTGALSKIDAGVEQ